MYHYYVLANFPFRKPYLSAYFKSYLDRLPNLTCFSGIFATLWEYVANLFISKPKIVMKAPGTPKMIAAGPQSVKMSWKEPKHVQSKEGIRAYRVRIHNLSGNKERIVQADETGGNSKRQRIELHDLKPGYKYRFVVSAICGKHGESKPSKMSNIIVPEHSCDPPGKPDVRQLSTDSVHLKWTPPRNKGNGVTIEGYRVRFYSSASKRWHEGRRLPDTTSAEIDNLDCRVKYKFTVKAVCNKGESNDSESSDEILIKFRPKDAFRYNSEIISHAVPPVYLLNPNEETNHTDDTHNLRMCEIGSPSNCHKNKVMIIVGATGAGKTTLINGMINYMVGVEWIDKFRFKLIADVAENKSQSKSQTHWITSYTIHHQDGYRVPYTLTLVDTPGFGDTSGIKRDKEITDQIRNFLSQKELKGIDHIDAIGFVAQSALPRLTPTQQFIFDSILALFGKDIAKNIFMLVTFADGNHPPVLAGIKEAGVPYEKHFKFNNSALFASNEENVKKRDRAEKEDNFEQMFWEMGLDSFGSLFDVLNKTRSKNLDLTREVLQERFGLERTLQDLQRLIKDGFDKIEQLRTAQSELDQHRKDELKYQDFTTTLVKEASLTVPVAVGTYTTNCLNCNFTCHYPCPYSDDNAKVSCIAMVNEYCTICPKKCHWSSHKNMNVRFQIQKTEQKQDSEDLKQKYQDTIKEREDTEEFVGTLTSEIKEVTEQVKKLAEDVKRRFERLELIALKPNPLKSGKYIDLLIDTEKKTANEGWQSRVEQLQDLRHQAKIMFQATKDNYDPFAEPQETEEDQM